MSGPASMPGRSPAAAPSVAAPCPFHFGAAAAPLFGWLHRPAPALDRGLGLVLCPPFGFEAVCSHRTLRRIAQVASMQGVATLRFDPAGTGQSHGDAGDPGQWQGWIDSVHAAVEALRRHAGVGRVVLAGLRLGATLAALAAAQREDVAALVAIAPVVNGREHLRELRLLGARGDAAGSTGGALEAGGFVLGPDSVAALRALDLARLGTAPAPRVWLFERTELAPADAWATALAGHGAALHRMPMHGYPALMTNPQDAQVPDALVAAVAAAAVAVADRVAAPASIAAPVPLPAPDGAERPVRIDNGDAGLFGILSRPARAAPRGGRAVLMLNAGAVPAFGPSRLWVALARRWAARGVTVLRLDLSGIGDSPARAGLPDNHVYSRAAAGDIAAALAWLRHQPGVERCAVMGLCSGAFHALQAAIAGQPVDRVLMVNPLTFDWDDCQRLGDGLNEFELLAMSRRYRRQLGSIEPWRRLLAGQLDLPMIGRAVAGRLRSAAREHARRLGRAVGLAPGTPLGRQIAATARRGTTLHVVFATGAPGHELLQRTAGPELDALQRRGALTIDLVPDADHTFTAQAARERLAVQLDALLLPPATPSAGEPAGTATGAPAEVRARFTQAAG